MLGKYQIYFFIIFLSDFVFCQAPYKDKCPTFENCTDKNFIFEQEKILGYYYPILKIPYYFEVGFQCNIFKFSQLENKTIYFDKNDIKSSTRDERNLFGIFQSTPNGTISLKFTEFEFPMMFKIISYTSDYFIALSCHDCGVFSSGGKGIYGYAFARVPWPSCDIIEEMRHKMNNCGIPDKYIVYEIQDGCNRCS